MTSTSPSAPTPSAATPSAGTVGTGRAPASPLAAVLRSEWLKIRSVRSLCTALALVFAATAGFTVLATATMPAETTGEPDFDPVFASFTGLAVGQIAAICFGALAVAAEYRTGAIRVSLAAVPRRGLLYAGKLAVIGALALLVGLVTSVTCFFTAQSLLGDEGVGPGSQGAVRAMAGGGVYIALITLLAAALTVLLRSAPLVMGILISFLIVVSFVLGGPGESGFIEYFPDHAGQQILLQDPTGTLGPWGGLGVLILWVSAGVWAGGSSFLRRDA
ncbi:ABC transporter permease subunit [Streptomyces sp. NPDC004609]|uniref:ABC transporter permease subunit n=1 Tax=Streptomyces sp. NPDC004609 TaxID=3364704 RepID=UPI0036AAF671